MDLFESDVAPLEMGVGTPVSCVGEIVPEGTSLGSSSHCCLVKLFGFPWRQFHLSLQHLRFSCN